LIKGNKPFSGHKWAEGEKPKRKGGEVGKKDLKKTKKRKGQEKRCEKKKSLKR